MAKPPRRRRRHEASDTTIIKGRAYSWRAVLHLRRKQVKECKAPQPQHSAVFELKDDWRPEAERSAAGCYREPTLLSLIAERGRD